MSIRLISGEEMVVIQDLAQRIWPDTFKEILTQEQIEYMLEWMYNPETLKKQVEQGHLFYIISENKIPLGFIGIEPNHPSAHQLKIHKLYVLPETQGSGLGKKLIQIAIDNASIRNISEIVLNVNRFNKAVTFYQHLGFSISYEENIDIGNGFWMEDYVMTLKVTNSSQTTI